MALLPEDPLAHRALESLLRAETAVRRRLTSELTREGLSPSGFSMLIVLMTAGGELELRTLRNRLRASKANATEVVSTLETAGLVSRHRLERDRRTTAVVLDRARPGSGRPSLPRAHRPRARRLLGPGRAREALAGDDLPQARRLSRAVARPRAGGGRTRT